MAQSKLLRVLGDLAPLTYRTAYLAVADPQELIDLHESGLAGRTGCRRLVVADTRSRRNGLDIEAVGSVEQVLRVAEPTGLLILDDPTLATLQSPTILTGAPGSLEFAAAAHLHRSPESGFRNCRELPATIGLGKN